MNNTPQLAQNDDLQELTALKYQRNCDHNFANIPIFDGIKKKDFFEWLERLETAYLQSRHDICTKALGRSEVVSGTT